MTSVVDMDFSDWLLEEMSKRGWSQADLARASGLHRQSISDYVNRRRTNPEPDALIAIANGLSISPVTAFRHAGLLPAEGGEKITKEDWKHMLQQLTPEEQEEIYSIMEMKIKRRQQAEQSARAANFKPGKVKK
jgi:transcriptional regulator with XRE-family HTH domain